MPGCLLRETKVRFRSEIMHGSQGESPGKASTEHWKLLLEADVSRKAFEQGACRRVREFARLHLVEAASVYATFGNELRWRDLLQRTEYVPRKFGFPF